jgi:hypothetical protein
MTSIEISTDQNRLDVAMIHAYLANDSYWVPGTHSSDSPHSQTRKGRWSCCARKPHRRRPATHNTEGVIRLCPGIEGRSQ